MADNEDAAQASEVARIKDRIATFIEQRFAKGAARYYLAQLGSDLGDDRKTLEKLTRLSLSKFVRANFSFEIGRAGPHENELYLVRPESAGPATESTRIPVPRYVSRFWAAFSVPLPEGQRRFVNLRTLSFGPNEDELRLLDGQVREIDSEFISSRDGSPAADIAAQIDRWLQQQNLDPADFLVGRRLSKRDDAENLLEQILASLSIEQLRRVTLPLDVIRTLSERRRVN